MKTMEFTVDTNKKDIRMKKKIFITTAFSEKTNAALWLTLYLSYAYFITTKNKKLTLFV